VHAVACLTVLDSQQYRVDRQDPLAISPNVLGLATDFHFHARYQRHEALTPVTRYPWAWRLSYFRLGRLCLSELFKDDQTPRLPSRRSAPITAHPLQWTFPPKTCLYTLATPIFSPAVNPSLAPPSQERGAKATVTVACTLVLLGASFQP